MFTKLWQCRKKCTVDSTSKLHEHRGFMQSSKLWLNLRLFRWLIPSLKPSSWFTSIIERLSKHVIERLILQHFQLQKYEMMLRKSNKNLLYYKFTAVNKTIFQRFFRKYENNNWNDWAWNWNSWQLLKTFNFALFYQYSASLIYSVFYLSLSVFTTFFIYFNTFFSVNTFFQFFS